jgi:pentatricopeptide repeat protein
VHLSQKDITLKCWDVVVHDHHIILDEGLCMAVLHTAARHGLPSLAAEVLSMLDTLSVPVQEHHYASIIEALIKADQLQDAIAALRLMETHGIAPLETTARPIVNAIRQSTAKLDETWTILDTLHAQDERGVSVIAINVYINAALQRGDLQRAVGIYKAASGYNVAPNVETFNLLLHGCVQAGHRELGDRFLQEMRAAGVKPDVRTYENMIWLCLSQSTYEDAFFYLEEMKGQGFLPGLKVYEGIVKKCVAQGDTRYTIALDEMKECGYKISPELRKFIDKGGAA